ncbi:MAG: hypothetical protein ACFCUE_15610 [Candidatus Bathyarchaeia archaeon]
MGALKSLAQGFLITTSLVWLYNIAELTRTGNGAIGILYLLIMLIPIISIIRLRNKTCQAQNGGDSTRKWREIIFSFQGVALSCWSFDLLTTYYAIDVTGIAVEINPLGWPLGILGAFAYYGPTLVLSYYLLFRVKEKISMFAAVPMTTVMLLMGSMNLFAGAENLKIFVYTVTINPTVYYGLLALIVTVNFTVQLALKRMVAPQKIAF